MGRPREHNAKEVRLRVMRCFWELGFTNASMAELEEAAGVNRRQLARDYGDKRGLFLSALEDFAVAAGRRLLEPMEARGAGRQEITATMRLLATGLDAPDTPNGCLICHTSSDPIAKRDAVVRKKVQTYFNRIEAAYANALRGAVASGDVGFDDSQVTSVSRQFFAVHVSLLVLARAGVAQETLSAIAEQTLATLD